MPITLSLAAPDLDDDSLQELTRQLCRDLRDDAGIDAVLATQPAAAGTRGDLPVWGQIVIAAIGSGGALVALVNVLKAWVQRKRSVQLKLQNKDGQTIELNAENQNPAELAALLKSFLADADQK